MSPYRKPAPMTPEERERLIQERVWAIEGVPQLSANLKRCYCGDSQREVVLEHDRR